MTRGKGVRLQRYKDGGISDLAIFTMDDGLTWDDRAGRNFNRKREELAEWMGDRATRRPHGAEGLPAVGQVRRLT